MVTKKVFYSALTALLLVTGCGNDSTGTNASTETGTTKDGGGNPEVYSYKVINNQGEAVASKLGSYEIYLYSDSEEKADDKSPHKGIVVKVNDENSELMPIQATYMHKDIVAKVYKNSELVVETEAVEVTDDEPVVLIETKI